MRRCQPLFPQIRCLIAHLSLNLNEFGQIGNQVLIDGGLSSSSACVKRKAAPLNRDHCGSLRQRPGAGTGWPSAARGRGGCRCRGPSGGHQKYFAAESVAADRSISSASRGHRNVSLEIAGGLLQHRWRIGLFPHIGYVTDARPERFAYTISLS